MVNHPSMDGVRMIHGLATVEIVRQVDLTDPTWIVELHEVRGLCWARVQVRSCTAYWHREGWSIDMDYFGGYGAGTGYHCNGNIRNFRPLQTVWRDLADVASMIARKG